MSQINIAGDTSGSIAVVAPLVAGSNTITLPASTGTVLTSVSPASDLPSSIKGPAFSAYQSSSQTGVSSSVWTKVTLTTENFDTNSNFASSRFTPTVAGYYQINGVVTMQSTTTTHFVACAIYKNGAIYSQSGATSGLSTFYPASTIANIVYLNGSTDYVELYVYGSAGGSTYNIYNTAENTNFNGSLARSV